MKRLKPIKNWDELPDMIGPQDYADVIGCSIKTAQNKFNSRGFPKKENGRVSKIAVMKHLGIISTSVDENAIYSLLLEIKQDVDCLKQSQSKKLELLKQVI